LNDFVFAAEQILIDFSTDLEDKMQDIIKK
jgi:hypothetical protein